MLIFRLCVMMFIQYIIWGSWYVTLTNYLTSTLGFTGTQAGAVFGTTALASLVAPFGYSTMLWAFVFGWLFFREIPVPLVFAGAAIVAGAGLYVFFRERQLGLRRPHEVEGQGGAG